MMTLKSFFFYYRECAFRLDDPGMKNRTMAIERHRCPFDQGMFYSDGH